MKALIVIPHFYKPAGKNTRYASYSTEMRNARRHALDSSIFNLQQLFGDGHYGAQHHLMKMKKLPNAFRVELDIKVCTTGGFHLVDELTCPKEWFEHIETDAEPLLLGFQCHNELKKRLGNYDYYCYLEDDIIIHDQFFFKKLELFNSETPIQQLLQPQRYDSAYFDGKVVKPFLTKIYPDFEACPAPANVMSYTFAFLGTEVTVAQSTHPHAGCFFLQQTQLEHLAEGPDFGNMANVNPVMALDHAATLAISKRFAIFKTAAESMNFFEVEHGVINMLKQVSVNEKKEVEWFWHPSQFDSESV